MVLGTLCGLAIPAAANAATITVGTGADSIGAPGSCTLRDAVKAANTDAASGGCPAGGGADTIMLGAGRFTLSIPRSGPDDNSTGDLNVESRLTIQGVGRDGTVIDGGGVDRVLSIAATTGNATIADVEITGGHAPDGAPGQPGGDGGGVLALGALTLRSCLVDRNEAGDGGAGLQGVDGGPQSSGGNGGQGGSGGGIAARAGTAIVAIAKCEIEANAAGSGGPGGAGGTPAASATSNGGDGNGGSGGDGGSGGGVALFDQGAISDSLLASNSAGHGGPGGNGGTGGSGLSAGGNATGGAGGSGGLGGGFRTHFATNVTAIQNDAGAGAAGGAGGTGGAGITQGRASGGPGGSAGAGGGGSSDSRLTNLTITGNRADAATAPGGAAGAGPNSTPGSDGAPGSAGGVAFGRLAFSIVFGNSSAAGTECRNTVSDGNNVVGAGCQSGQAGDTTVNPALGLLEDNGGPTPTIRPALGGSAIDIGDACAPTDQRGVPRPLGGRCDAGAYETGIAAATGSSGSPASNSATLNGTITPTLRTTTFHFDFGATASYGSSTPETTAARGPVTPVSVTLGGLSPSTTYHYRLVATSAEGTATGNDATFTTPAAPTPPEPQQPSPAPEQPALTPTPTTPAAEGIAFISDTGAAVVRLGKGSKFRLPGLRFTCPSTAKGPCAARITVPGVSTLRRSGRKLASGRVKVARGKTAGATLRGTSVLVREARRRGYFLLQAVAVFGSPGHSSVTVKKSFVLIARKVAKKKG